jgi:hypothetical protein
MSYLFPSFIWQVFKLSDLFVGPFPLFLAHHGLFALVEPGVQEVLQVVALGDVLKAVVEQN